MNPDTNAIPSRRVAPRNTSTRWSFGQWLTPLGLIFLSLIPALAGTVRLTQLAGGATVTAENARFFAMPLPVVIHIIGSMLYAMIGAFQFVPSFRIRYPRWHRRAGWIITPSGLAVALSGLWMAHFYPWPKGDGVILYVERLFFGSTMVLSLVLGVIAFWQRKYARHGAWMTRGYAIGLGAGTQAFTHMAWMIVTGSTPNEFTRAMLMGAGWVINLLVAEWVIQKRLTSPRRQTKLATEKLAAE